MKPQEVRRKISNLKESIEFGNVIVKTHLSYLDKRIMEKRLLEQRDIIDEAEKQISKIFDQRNNAVIEIGIIEQSQRYDKRMLTALKNYAKIQKLKELQEKIRKELENVCNDN